MVFKKIGLAITFSPSSKALLKEAKRLSDLFEAELFLFHCGEKTTEVENRIFDLLNSQGVNSEGVQIIIEAGEPAKMILGNSASLGIDLLISGALEKERTFKYYLGSVARKLMRKSECSILMLPDPSIESNPFKSFCVSVDYSTQGEKTLIKAYNFALLEKADVIHLVRESQLSGLSIAISDSGSMQEIDTKEKMWLAEEREKLDLMIKELNLKDIEIKPKCIHGKEGWAISQYVKEINADILVVPAPKDKLKFFDRLFNHDLEFIIKELPSPLLIVKS